LLTSAGCGIIGGNSGDSMRALLALTVTALCGGCVTSQSTPSHGETLRGDYARIAACAFQRLERESPQDLRFTDLRGTESARITAEVTGTFLTSATTRVWEATFRRAGENETAIEIRAMGTVYGADYYPNQVMAAARACI